MLNAVNVRKRTSDVSPWMPVREPLEQRLPGVRSSRLRVVGSVGRPAGAEVVHPALDLVDGLRDGGLDLVRLLVDPAEDEEQMTTPNARIPSRTMAAPAGRGTRRRCIFVTSGPATVARIAPRVTGRTIVDVSRGGR